MAAAQLKGGPNANAIRDSRVSYLLQPGEELFNCPYDRVHYVLEMKLNNHLTKCRHNYLNAVKSGRLKVSEDEEIIVCRFNYVHHMHRIDMAEHEASCPSNPEIKQKERDIIDALNQKEIEESFKRYEAKAATGFIPGERGDPGVGPYGEQRVKGQGSYYNPKGPSYAGFSSKVEKKEKKVDVNYSNNPEDNWELEDVKEVKVKGKEDKKMRFTMYNPQEVVSANLDKLITNPQGLTKSERRAHCQRANSRLLMEDVQQEEFEAKKEEDLVKEEGWY